MTAPRLVLLACWVLIGPLQAQSKPPRRPDLGAAADTNNALAYFRLGLDNLEKNPSRAADALYWANRLNPGWATALYARRVAMLRADERSLIRYFSGDRKAIREFAAQDSLYYRSLLIDPFLHTNLDKELIRHFWVAYYTDRVSRSGGSGRHPEVRAYIEEEIRRTMGSEAGIPYQAWSAFSDGRFPEALTLYGKLVGKKKPDPDARERRGTLFFLIQRYDSAAAELRQAISERAEREEKEEVFVYRSKALLQHKLGLALVRTGDLDGAREAFGRALEEDLAFYPAHLILANMAMTAGDSATAFREYRTATELNPQEPVPHLTWAAALVAAGQLDLAIEVFRTVIGLEPYYAQAYLDLGKALEAKGEGPAALAQYAAYLERTTRDDRARSEVQARIRKLTGASSEP